jgi:hypothetical protein
MIKIFDIIKGSTISDFIKSNSKSLRLEQYPFDTSTGINKISKQQLTTWIACFISEHLSTQLTRIGVEIKIPAKSRDVRAPLITFTEKSAVHVWKICNDIRDLDKDVLVVNDLQQYIIEQKTTDLPVVKIILLYATVDPSHYEYMMQKAKDHSVHIFSFETFIQDVLSGKFNLDNLISQKENLIYGFTN